MSESVKTTAASHPVAARGNLYRAAIVGAASLKGKEVAEMLNERNFPAVDVRLLDDDEALGQLEAMGDEISFIQSVRAEQFENVDFTFFASDEECTRTSWKRARDAGSTIIDLSSALENEPGAQVRSLWVERERGQIAPPELQPGPCVAAHPVAVMLALLLLRARKAGAIRRVTATIFEPASEHGQRGMDELHQQTVNLLSFQSLPRELYDAQVAYNLLAGFGESAKASLSTSSARIRRHFQALAGSGWPALALQAVHAPVFHGHTFSIAAEFERPIPVSAVEEALSGDHVDLVLEDTDSPSNLAATGQNDVLVRMRPEPGSRNPLESNRVWLWAASDNLRLFAQNAVACALDLRKLRPPGTVQ